MGISENSTNRIWKILTLSLVIGTIVYLSYYFSDILAVLVISLFVALVFNPIVAFLEKYRINRTVAVLVVFAVAGTLLTLSVSLLVPKIINQLNALAKNISKENIATSIAQMENFLKDYIPIFDSGELADKISDSLSGIVFTSVDNFSKILESVFSVLTVLVIVPFISFFFLKDKDTILNGLIDLVPNRFFEVSYSVLTKITAQLSRFVGAWILDAFLLGLMATAGLTILGIENAISIGFVAGIGHLIPYFGPIIGGLPAILISVIQFGDFSKFPEIVIMFMIIYTVDNGFIQPNVFSKGTDIHPLLIIVFILIGSKLLGVFGMLLAIPAATVIKTAAQEIFSGYKNYRIIRVSEET